MARIRQVVGKLVWFTLVAVVALYLAAAVTGVAAHQGNTPACGTTSAGACDVHPGP